MAVTIKDMIVTELAEGGEASHNQLATRLELNEPSVRRAVRELQMAGRVRIANYGGLYRDDHRTWELTTPLETPDVAHQSASV